MDAGVAGYRDLTGVLGSQPQDAPCGLCAERTSLSLSLPKPPRFPGQDVLVGSVWPVLLTVAENSRTMPLMTAHGHLVMAWQVLFLEFGDEIPVGLGVIGNCLPSGSVSRKEHDHGFFPTVTLIGREAAG